MREKRRASSEDLELLLDYHDDPMALSNIEGKILAINSKLALVLEKKKNELIGQSGFEYIGKQVIRTRKDAIKIVLETKKPYIFTDYDRNRWWSTEIKPIMNKDGNIVKFAIYIKDITREKTSEEKLKSILNQSLMGIGIVKGGEITYVNDTVELITGYSKNEYMVNGVKIFSKIIHPDDRDFVLEQLRKKLIGDTDAVNQYTFRLISKSGSIKWLELYSKTIFLEGENADLINIIDITQEKIAEKNLEDSEYRWNSLVDNLPESDRILIIDNSGRILYVNRTYPDHNIDDVIGKKIDDFIPKDSIKIIKFYLNEVFKKGISKKYESYINTPDGKKHYFHTIAAPIKKNNQVQAALCIAIDNTKLKNTETELKLSTNYMKNILNSASEVIFTINSEKKIGLWNKSAEKKTGFKQINTINKPIKNIKLFENIKEIDDYIKLVFDGKNSSLKEIMVNTNFGQKLLLGVSSTIIKNELNKISDILFVCWDITHDKNISGPLYSGKSYILFDQKVDRAIKIFDNNFNEIQKGLVISRDIKDVLDKTTNKGKIDIVKLSSIKEEKIINISDITELKNSIERYLKKNKKSIILVDRIDYLISINSFENVIQALYEINDLIINTKSILLIRLNSSLLNYNQRIRIEQEYNKIPNQIIKDIQIDEKVYKILNFINEKNKKNLIATFQQIGKEFNISKLTVKKRVEIMKNNDFIYYINKGSSKGIYITDKGKSLLK